MTCIIWVYYFNCCQRCHMSELHVECYTGC